MHWLWHTLAILACLLCPPLVYSAPANDLDHASNSIRPLVIWHGLGDSHGSPGILGFIEEVKKVHPGIFVHSVYLHEKLDDDRKASFYGNVDEQVEFVHEQLNNATELKNGFDAIGFSQGGQFLRAYVERYNSPPVNNLITFGSQHMGVSDLPACRPFDLLCQVARRAARAGVYTQYAQENLVSAQYFRDPDQMPAYLASNRFLTSINNELDDTINKTYAENFATLQTLVLVLFSEDQTVVPKESSWFGSYSPPEDDEVEKTIIPMRQQPLYMEDRIGLRTLDERGSVVLKACAGEHMEISTSCWRPLVRKYVGGPEDEPLSLDSVLRVQ